MKNALAPWLLLAGIALAQTAPLDPTTPRPAKPFGKPLAAGAPKPGAKPAEPPPLEWHDAASWGAEGLAAADLGRTHPFDRLPEEAQAKIAPPVWILSRDAAGLVVRFRTDAPTIWAKYTLRNGVVAKPAMPATGASGVDLYARDADGQWRWVDVIKPAGVDVQQEFEHDFPNQERDYLAYLPLYNGVESLSFGVPPGSRFEGQPPRTDKPLVFYGGANVQGLGASRPGAIHPAILGRWFDMPVVNLGFGGNGKMDLELEEYLARIDAAAYIIDCLPNMGPPMVKAKAAPFLKALRTARPETPIILVEDRPIARAWLPSANSASHPENHATLRQVFDSLQKEGLKKLYYVSGEKLYGDDGEGSVDASHLDDLGYRREAEAFVPILREALAGK